jgi:two-component system LytT family response regulator
MPQEPGLDTMIRTLLADDEVLARQRLRRFLKEISDIEVVGESTSPHETVQLAKLTAPDLLFLDFCGPAMKGFDVIDALSSLPDGKRPRVVFVAANDRCAVRAFEMRAVDYLLKPYSLDRLRTAVDRVRDLHASRANAKSRCNGANLESATQSDGQSRKARDHFATRLVFKSRSRILFLPIRDIRWIEAEENYVRICTGSESHLLRQTIGHLESMLDPDSFLRVHRSAIVNLQYVREVKNETDGAAKVFLKSGEMIPMSRSYRTRIQELLKIDQIPVTA